MSAKSDRKEPQFDAVVIFITLALYHFEEYNGSRNITNPTGLGLTQTSLDSFALACDLAVLTTTAVRSYLFALGSDRVRYRCSIHTTFVFLMLRILAFLIVRYVYVVSWWNFTFITREEASEQAMTSGFVADTVPFSIVIATLPFVLCTIPRTACVLEVN